MLLREFAVRHSLPIVDAADDPAQFVPLAVTFSACAAVLWGYGRARPVGSVMLVSGCLTGFGGLCVGLESFLAPTSGDVTAAMDGVGAVTAQLGILVALILLPQVFPDGVLRGRRWLVAAWVSTGAVVVSTLDLVVVGVLVGDEEWPWSVHAVVIAAAGLVGVVTLVVRWHGAARSARGQILGFVIASAIPVAALLVTLLPPLWDANVDWLLMFWPIGVAAAVLVAVVRYDLYGIRSTARRVAIYAAVVAVLTGAFAAVLVVLLGALSGQVVAGQFRWLAVAAVTVVILAVDPVRRRLLTRIERRLLGQRSDVLPALSRLGGASSPEAYTTIVGTVATVVRSPGVALSVQNRDELRVVASCGQAPVDPVILPLSYGGELVGELAIAPRTPGERFQAADDKLLALLAIQVAIQLYVARRDAELTMLRQETVQQSAAQRAQLGQDLHDGLAPLLAGASLTADALRRGMPPGSRDESDAARLTHRLLQASTEVRRLAHDLQSTVHDRGLERAIRDHIAGLQGTGAPTVTAEIRVDDLPAAVIEAAYLIVLEAINNAVRHGHPHHVRVIVGQHPREVTITVEDDGVGISQPYISGLGITSMRRRADALDGWLQLVPRPGGGTVLTATLRSHP